MRRKLAVFFIITILLLSNSMPVLASGKTGLYKEDGDYWYYYEGTKMTAYTGLAKHSGTWYYIKNGKRDLTYTGFCANKNGTFYVEKGIVSQKRTDIVKGKVNGETAWWYIVNSKVQFDAVTMAKNKNGWHYINHGKVDTKFTGFAENKNGIWYMEKGKLTKKTGLVKTVLGSEKAYYHVINGKYTKDTTLVKSTRYYYYVKNGKIDYSYTGYVTDSRGTWLVQNGKVTEKANGVYGGYVVTRSKRGAKTTKKDTIKPKGGYYETRTAVVNEKVGKYLYNDKYNYISSKTGATTITVTPAYDEKVLVKGEWIESIYHPEETKKVKVVDKKAWTETINHPEETKQVKVVDKEAWTEKVLVKEGWEEIIRHEPIIERTWEILIEPAWDEPYEVGHQEVHTTCNGCGEYFDGFTEADMDAHLDSCGSGGWGQRVFWIVDGIEYEHHDAVTELIHEEPSSDMTVLNYWEEEVEPTWDEEVYHKPEYTTIKHPEEYHYETQVVPVWTETINHPEEYHYETKVVKKAWTETINHPEEYHYETKVVKKAYTETVKHPAEYKTVHHAAVTKKVKTTKGVVYTQAAAYKDKTNTKLRIYENVWVSD